LRAKRSGEAAAAARSAELSWLANQLAEAMDQLDDIVDKIASI
jgi:hypothetical protein